MSHVSERSHSGVSIHPFLPHWLRLLPRAFTPLCFHTVFLPPVITGTAGARPEERATGVSTEVFRSHGEH